MAKATTVAEGLTRINNAKEAIRQAIVSAGVPCDTSVKFEDYPNKVASLSEGLDDAELKYIGLLSGSITSITIPGSASGSLIRYGLAYQTALTSVDFGSAVSIPNYYCYYDNALKTASGDYVTVLGDYSFSQCSSLETINFPSVKRIGQRCFESCLRVKTISLSTLEYVGTSGLAEIGRDGGTLSFAINLTKNATIESRAFYSCTKLTAINGGFSSIGESAFSGCSKVESLNIPNDVNVTSLGQSAFERIGMTRANKETVKFVFPFGNSTFTAVPQYCFRGGGATIRVENLEITLPSTVTSIAAYAFQFTDHIRIFLNSAPTLASTTAFDGCGSDVYVVCSPENLDTLSGMTNWSAASVLSRIIGGGKGYESGTTLPEYTRNGGNAITWYDSIDKTNVVTTSQGADITYYCTVGTTRIVWFVNEPNLKDATVVITDGVNLYYEGDHIPVGTSVTITISGTDPTKPLIKSFKVNGVKVENSNTTTVSMTQDLSISASYWDGQGVPVEETLNDNDWDTLKQFSLSIEDPSDIPAAWLGQTHDFTYLGRTYEARLVDTTGKHTRVSDGSNAWLLFEVTEVNPTTYAFSSSGSNNVADSPLLKSFNNTDGTGARWLELPSDLRAVLEDVNVLVAPTGTGTTTPTNLPFKVFFGREADLFSSRSYSVAAEFNAITQDEYYQSNNNNAARIKYAGGTTTARWYWLMSPYSGGGGYVCAVSTDGSASNHGATTPPLRVAFRFAI